MKDMDGATFFYHVNDNKNEFANWIRDVFGNQELADKLYQEKTKQGVMKVLDSYVSNH